MCPFPWQSNFWLGQCLFSFLSPKSILLDFSELLQLFLSAPHKLTFNYLPTGYITWFSFLSAESEHNFLLPPPSPTPNWLYLMTPISKIVPLFLPALSLKIFISLCLLFQSLASHNWVVTELFPMHPLCLCGSNDMAKVENMLQTLNIRRYYTLFFLTIFHSFLHLLTHHSFIHALTQDLSAFLELYLLVRELQIKYVSALQVVTSQLRKSHIHNWKVTRYYCDCNKEKCSGIWERESIMMLWSGLVRLRRKWELGWLEHFASRWKHLKGSQHT